MIWSGGSYGTTNAWEVATGRHLVTLIAFAGDENAAADDWLAYAAEGYYDGSAGIERYLAWRVGNELLTPEALTPQRKRPDKIQSSLVLGSRKLATP
jgi:hypothetical protein